MKDGYIANWTCAPGTIAVMLHGSKENQCLSNASQHVYIYLQPFSRNSSRKIQSSQFQHIFAHFGLPWVRPWDNLQPFLRYSKLLVENCDIFTPHLCLAAPRGVTPSEFRGDLGIHTKLEWMGYRVVKTSWQYVQPFWYSTSVWQTDGRPAYYVLQHSWRT